MNGKMFYTSLKLLQLIEYQILQMISYKDLIKLDRKNSHGKMSMTFYLFITKIRGHVYRDATGVAI